MKTLIWILATFLSISSLDTSWAGALSTQTSQSLEWCRDHQDDRTWTICGKVARFDQAEARQMALEEAQAHFYQLCKASDECFHSKMTVALGRDDCEQAPDADNVPMWTCGRQVKFTEGDRLDDDAHIPFVGSNFVPFDAQRSNYVLNHQPKTPEPDWAAERAQIEAQNMADMKAAVDFGAEMGRAAHKAGYVIWPDGTLHAE